MNKKIIVVAGPSGAGKGEACQAAQKDHPELMLSVSVATRSPRPQEHDGVHYHFWPGEEERFLKSAAANYFLEWEQVYDDPEGYRGTPASEIPRIWVLGRTPLLDIDVEGAIRIKEMYGAEALCLFIKPSPLGVWEEMLRGRDRKNGTPIEKTEKRIRKGPAEILRAQSVEGVVFDKIITNEFDPFFYNKVANWFWQKLGTPEPFVRSFKTSA